MLRKAVKKMGEFSFVYGHGLFHTSGESKSLIALFDAHTEAELESLVFIMDRTFKKFASPRVDREYSEGDDCWYATYVVPYPFTTDDQCGQYDWQNAKPLF